MSLRAIVFQMEDPVGAGRRPESRDSRAEAGVLRLEDDAVGEVAAEDLHASAVILGRSEDRIKVEIGAAQLEPEKDPVPEAGQRLGKQVRSPGGDKA
jgi:hypothetical protein